MRIRSFAVIMLTVLCLAGSAGAQLNEDEVRRLVTEYRTLRAQFEAQARQLADLTELVIKYQRNEQTLREALVRRGVDVEQLLAPPPTTQAEGQAAPGLVFESPESVAEYLRENFSQRIRPEMTRLQRDLAERDFNSWLNSAALLPTQVTWVMRVGDVWRATGPEQVELSYYIDREPMVAKLSALTRTLDELEMLELNLARLKAEQKARKERHELRTRELAKAPPTHKALAERVMRQAYDRLVEVNVQVREAEGRLTAAKIKRPPKSTTQPEIAEYRLIMRAGGGRDKTIELNVFCHERDGNRLMEASRGSLIKVRGWISDIALAPQVATLGIRIDHAEVLAVNVEDLPPPPASAVEPKTPSDY